MENVVVERDGKGDIVLAFDADGHLLGVEIIGAACLLHGSVLSKPSGLDFSLPPPFAPLRPTATSHASRAGSG
ncbi:DUF2283 domain-containing protein [Actinoplanes sp. NPDC049118]|uniref:DUF2283 domain-containing protein n=1 Tax=Actinoplanes sp. NPDC049118 TaxID=3155769 RepID=UPI0033FE46ED